MLWFNVIMIKMGGKDWLLATWSLGLWDLLKNRWT